MQYSRLGNSGLIVSRLSFGAMTFTAGSPNFPGVGKLEEYGARQLVARSLDAGVNFFDTADVYGRGDAEHILGRALAPHRKDVMITTKVGMRFGDALNDAGLSRRHILASVDASLARLGTDWIDTYVVHCHDPFTPLEETLLALDHVVRVGKVRYLGFSNWPTWRVVTAMEMMRANGLARFTHGQMHYSLLGRDIEQEFVPMAAEYGLGLTVWSPLVGGFLSGKYSRDSEPGTDTRYATFDIMPFDRDRGYAVLEKIATIAATKGASVSQVAIAWLLGKPFVSSVLIGAVKPQQLDDNLGAAQLVLTAEEMAMLDQASATPKSYPHWFIDSTVDRLRADALGQ